MKVNNDTWVTGVPEGEITYSARVQKAVAFAIKTHWVDDKQMRKGKDVPFITHPLTVGLILAHAGAPEDAIIAGILHDTIEDSKDKNKVTRGMIAEHFGSNVANFVADVTEFHKERPWEERKREALDHVETMSYESVLVKSADVIANTTELIGDYERENDKENFWKRFNAPEPKKENTLGNYQKVISELLRCWPENPLANDLRQIEQRIRSLDAEEAKK